MQFHQGTAEHEVVNGRKTQDLFRAGGWASFPSPVLLFELELYSICSTIYVLVHFHEHSFVDFCAFCQMRRMLRTPSHLQDERRGLKINKKPLNKQIKA